DAAILRTTAGTLIRGSPGKPENMYMKSTTNHFLFTSAAAISLAFSLALNCFAEQVDTGDRNQREPIRHVLLVSIDGLHAVDLANYVKTHPNSALAQLSRHAITYPQAS